MKPKLSHLLLCLTPLVVGLLGAVLVQNSDLSGSLLQIRVELEYLVVGLGLLLSLLLFLVYRVRATRLRQQQTTTELERQRARREHARFTDRLDHELKNPLTTIRLNLENIRASQAGSLVRDSLDSIEGQATRLVKLTDDLRKLSAFETADLSFEAVDLYVLCDALRDECSASPIFRERELSLVLPSAPWPVRPVLADPDLLQVALYNLLENAAKYSNAGDSIELSATEAGDFARILVADTGIGIQAEDQDRIFDELYRGRNARKRAGSGIGLTLVHRVIEKLNGEISIRSELGRGTQVTLSLPLVPKS